MLKETIIKYKNLTDDERKSIDTTAEYLLENNTPQEAVRKVLLHVVALTNYIDGTLGTIANIEANIDQLKENLTGATTLKVEV